MRPFGASITRLESFGLHLTKPFTIGNQYNYRCYWQPGSSVFDKARATGLQVNDWQERHHRQYAFGQRFFDETDGNFTANNHKQIKDYRYGDLPKCEEHHIPTPSIG